MQSPEPALAEGSRLNRYYQLTHDYLVPSLRDWLTRQQKGTRRGRAELLLADLALVWNARPEIRQLPNLAQWLRICLFTERKSRTPPQQRMMASATHFHAVRGALVLVLVALACWVVYEGFGRMKAHALRDRLMVANTAEVPAIVNDVAGYRRWVDPLLRDARADAEARGDARKHLHASLALLPVDPGQADYLCDCLLEAEPHDVAILRDALGPHKAKLLERLWAIVENPPTDCEGQRLRAAPALADFDPDSPRWEAASADIVGDLVSVNAVYLGIWSEEFRPVKDRLLESLAAVYRRRQPERSAERTLATNLLTDYAADRPDVLADLVMDADERQFAIVFPRLQAAGESGQAPLRDELDRRQPADAGDDDRERLAKRQANAAVALLRFESADKPWRLLRHSADPTPRSYLIHRLIPQGVAPNVIINRIADEPDPSIQQALILSLGAEEFIRQKSSPEASERLVGQMRDLYTSADDPGVHAAAEWLLRQLHEEPWLLKIIDAWAQDAGLRRDRLQEIERRLARDKESARPQWYVNSQGQTLIVIAGPVEVAMGSPPAEEGRDDVETQHRKRIGRSFAIAAKPVAIKEYLRYRKDHDYLKKHAPDDDCPVPGVTWYMAAAYCNWLSQREGLDKCYEEDARGTVIRLKDHYLSLSGYRLPTEAEWEFACRAGTKTARCYGESEELLDRYGWYVANSKERTWPAGSKKPNELGLFDMHGNVWNWCQDRFQSDPDGGPGVVIDDTEDILTIDDRDFRVWRGGSFVNFPWLLRSAARLRLQPSYLGDDGGFRPARTIR